MNFRPILSALFFAAILPGLVSSANAQGKPRDPLVEIALVSELRVAKPGETFWIALHQSIYPGWHTYWINGGDSGAPPVLKWRLPEGYDVGALNFPPPERIPYMDLMNFGYSDEVIEPIQITVPEDAEPGTSVFINADTTILVCEEICIPEDGAVSLMLTIGETNVRDEVWGDIVGEAVAALPAPSPWPVVYEVTGDTVKLHLKAPDLAAAFASGTIQEASFFPMSDGLMENAEEQNFVASEDGVKLSVSRGYEKGDIAGVSGLLVFTQDLADGTITNAFLFEGTPGLVGLAEGSGGGALVVLKAVFFAFLGGIILNIMPCVFPVLFLKALAFMGKGGEDARVVRLEGFSYTAGVVLSFAALGAVLIGLRAGGELIGWGFQLQTPQVVGALAFLLFAVGLSLSGVFSIGGSIAGLGSSLASAKGHWGSFFTGVLATIVATPCTAPFMGAALGFALTQSALTAMAIFVSLGLGMAMPFLLLSFFPGLASKLPKPGAWMERAKQLLAFPMYGAAAWLVWVFGLQARSDATLAMMVGLVVVGFAAWVFETTRMAKGRWPLFGKAIAGLTLVSIVVFLTQIETGSASGQNGQVNTGGTSNGMAYEVYSQARVDALVADGKPVFVNFTAAWCISCLANEKVVFSSGAVAVAFASRDVTYMKADWTNRDPEITKALASFDRAGVPLYLYYSGEPGALPQILPQILTAGIVLEAIGG